MRDTTSSVRGETIVETHAFRSPVLVRFAHCDPAGIVFFPRYMEMFNNLVEDWCREGLQISFAEMHLERGWGMSTVHLEVDFAAPSFLGEELSATLVVRSIGTSSVRLEIALRDAEGRDRVRGQMVLVMVEAQSKRARPLPDDLRARMSVFQSES
ncbi:MAG TPA: thioesterase family protein [Gemmatimonadaceae bacterium]|nr:thioesterase family protein [Gemmatimonadaceae bacterium]